MKYTDSEYREAHENVKNVVSRAKDLVMQSRKDKLLALVNRWFNRGLGGDYILEGDSLIEFYQSIKREVKIIDGDYEPVQ